MVYHKHTCSDHKFKQHIKHKHRKCNKKNISKYVIGRKLKAFYNITLMEDKAYKVCSNIFEEIKNYNVPHKRKEYHYYTDRTN